ncbi:hypothetical protein K8R03_01705 [Candidatus Kaiserbacteria bacterium]|nr:hypothetical protein [Candidatus Kaiserbacteria bacterium]
MNSGTTTLLILKALAGNDPVRLLPLQKMILPHEHAIETVWWILWILTFLYLTIRYVIVPLSRKWHR